jgi:hypothetical protein
MRQALDEIGAAIPGGALARPRVLQHLLISSRVSKRGVRTPTNNQVSALRLVGDLTDSCERVLALRVRSSRELVQAFWSTVCAPNVVESWNSANG